MQKALNELIKARQGIREQRDELDAEYMQLGEQMAKLVEETGLPASKIAPKKRQSAGSSRQPNHESTAKKYEDFEPAASGCLCGCGEHVAEGAPFVRGHQHRLRSIALAFEAGKIEREKMSQAGYDYAVSKGWIVEG